MPGNDSETPSLYCLSRNRYTVSNVDSLILLLTISTTALDACHNPFQYLASEPLAHGSLNNYAY